MTRKVAIGTVLISLLAGCDASVAPSVRPTSPTAESPVPAEESATPMASHRASDSPEQAPTADVTASLGPNAMAEVVTTGLVMRSEPGVEAPSEILPYALQPGDPIFILDGPVHATLYDWYRVQPVKEADLLGIGWAPTGWVAAASRQGEPWIAARLTSCPEGDDVETAELAELHALEALACFGDRALRVRASAMVCPGYVSGAPAIPNYMIEPTWLGSGQGCALHTADGRTVYEAAAPFFAPAVLLNEIPNDWMWLSGQFDHPAASSCLLHKQSGDPLMPAAPNLDDVQVVLLCRSHLAVTAVVAASPPND